MPNYCLLGKSALVTGGARRIGRQIALALAEAGSDVTITYQDSSREAKEVALTIQAIGRNSQALPCNVRSEQSVRAAVEASVGFHGKLDLLINNAATFESAPLDHLSIEQWDTVFETNARGPFLVARESLPHLRHARGRIVNIGSLGGVRAWAGHAHYCASKAALHMLTQSMAKAYAPEVTVNCIAPGWIEQETDNRETADRFAERTPLRRNGTAEEVAQSVLFFAAGPRFITGQILVVDGGLGL